jgi:hypothetical protein
MIFVYSFIIISEHNIKITSMVLSLEIDLNNNNKIILKKNILNL